MKTTKILIAMLFSTVLILSNGCSDSEPTKETFLEGEPILGIKIFFPLGFYDAEPLMPKISPNGKKLLFTGPASLAEWKGLWVMDLETSEKILLHLDGKLGDWSPTSDSVVFIIGSDLFKMGINNSDIIQLTFNGSNFSPDWSPDGDYILYDNTDCGSIVDPIPENSCGVKLLDCVANHNELIVNFVRNPKWFPNQEKFLTSGGGVYDLIGNTIGTLALQEGYKGADINAEDQIIFSNSKGILFLNNIISKRILPNHLYDGIHGNINLYSAYPSWHPDGKHIIYEHFEIMRTKRITDATHVEGVIRFYKVNVDSALNISNLP